MTRRKHSVLSVILGLAPLTLACVAMLSPPALLGGCEKKKEASPPPPPPPPAPPAPERVSLDPILAAVKPSAKVQFPSDKAPYAEGLARALAQFSSALAKPDSDAFAAMLQPDAKALMAQLQAGGGWDEATAKIEAVRVVYVDESPAGPDAVSAVVFLAVQDPDGAYVLGWNALKVDDKWLFKGAAATGKVKRRASEWDGESLGGLSTDEAAASDEAPAAPPEDATPGDKPGQAPSDSPGGDSPGAPPSNPPHNPRRPTVPTSPG